MKNIIVFDLETNGFAGSSVLSVFAIKIGIEYIPNQDVKFNILEEYERFYFRRSGELLNHRAIEINRLTDEKIEILRNGCNYPENFNDDLESLKKFCLDTNHYIAHNIKFDSNFIDFRLKNKFCTMESNADIVKSGLSSARRYKWPKLSETALFYKIDYDTKKLHTSRYDTLITAEIFKKMFYNNIAKPRVLSFIEAD